MPTVRGTLELVFHPNLTQYGALSSTEERRLARNRLLSELLERLTYRNQEEWVGATWNDPVEIEVVSGNLDPTSLATKLAEKLALMVDQLGPNITVRSLASTPGLYYYYDEAGKKMWVSCTLPTRQLRLIPLQQRWIMAMSEATLDMPKAR